MAGNVTSQDAVIVMLYLYHTASHVYYICELSIVWYKGDFVSGVSHSLYLYHTPDIGVRQYVDILSVFYSSYLNQEEDCACNVTSVITLHELCLRENMN